MNSLRVSILCVAGLATSCASGVKPVRSEAAMQPDRRTAVAVPQQAPADESRTGKPNAERTHVVKRGETAYRIARNFGVSVDELAAANGLIDPRKIFVGQRLTIPLPLDLDALQETPAPASMIEKTPPGQAPTEALVWIWPVDGALGSRFGAERRHGAHAGVDILAAAGTPVRAARSGRVVFSGSRGQYGRLVIIDHEDGYSSYYSHNRENLVSEGDWVEQGETVAECGQSGNATAPHVHFEIHRAGAPIDPLSCLP